MKNFSPLKKAVVVFAIVTVLTVGSAVTLFAYTNMNGGGIIARQAGIVSGFSGLNKDAGATLSAKSVEGDEEDEEDLLKTASEK